MTRFLFFFYFFSFSFFLHAIPDCTIMGYVMPEDGLGKLPINILETLGSNFNANIIFTSNEVNFNENELPERMLKAINNSDKEIGRIFLMTDLLWYKGVRKQIKIPEGSLVKLAYSMFETTQIPEKWVKILNKDFDAVIVPDQYLTEVYENSGVNIPIFVLPIPMNLSPFFSYPMQKKKKSKPFVFFDGSACKNPEPLILAFAKVFGNNPNVQLVFRAVKIWGENESVFQRLIPQLGLKNVKVEEGPLSLNEFIHTLSSCNCYVNLSRGEGFSFIPREALALGVPVMIADNTASSTICKSGLVKGIKSRKKVPAWSHYRILFEDQCGMQFECKSKDIVSSLIDVYENYGSYLNRAKKGREWVKQYDCYNPELQASYRALLKPNKVQLGKSNKIVHGVLTTSNHSLYNKYLKIIEIANESQPLPL